MKPDGSVSQDAGGVGVLATQTPGPHWLAGTTQAVKEKGSGVSGHLLCASQHAKPDTHTVLVKGHNDRARHGFILILQMGTLRLHVVMVSDQDPTARR